MPKENQSDGRAHDCDHEQIFCAHGHIHEHRKSRVIGVLMAMCTSKPIIGKRAPRGQQHRHLWQSGDSSVGLARGGLGSGVGADQKVMILPQSTALCRDKLLLHLPPYLSTPLCLSAHFQSLAFDLYKLSQKEQGSVLVVI